MARATGARRWLRALAHLLLALFAVLLALASFALVALRTPWGSRLLLAQLVPRINAEIRGSAEIARISLSPRRVALYGLSLRDPNGNDVIKVANIEVVLSPWDLLHHVVAIPSMSAVAPELNLHLDPNGESNLSRAIAPRRPHPASKPNDAAKAGQPWSFRLGQLTVRDARVAVADERRPPESPWRSIRFHLAAAHLEGRYAPTRLEVDLDLRGELEAPLSAPVHVTLSGDGSGPTSLHTRATLAVDRSGAELGVHVQGDRDLSTVSADLVRLHVDPALLRQLFPGSPISAEILGSARLAWDRSHGDLRADVGLQAGGAQLSIAARANAKTRSLDGLTLNASKVDLARLLRDAPASNLSIECRAHGRGTSLADLDGALTIRMPQGKLDGHVAGPVRLTAGASRGRIRLRELFVSAPGVTMTAEGSASPTALSLRGSLALEDLGALLRSISGETGPVPTRGSGRIAFAVSGSPTSPSLRLDGRLQAVAWNDLAVPSLSVGLRVPDARNPLAADLTLGMPEGRMGTRLFQGLSLHLRGAGPRFLLHLAFSRPEPVVLWLGGRWSGGHRRLTLSRAQLSLPLATWTLRRTAELDIRAPRIRLSDFFVAAGDQSMRVDFDKRADGLHARVSVSRIDLSRLPQRLLSIPRMAGRVSADLELRQSGKSRSGNAHLEIVQASIGAIDRMNSAVDAQLSGERAKAKLTVSAWGAQAKGQLDLPARWPPAPASAVSADLDVSAIALDRVMAALSHPAASAGSPLPKLSGTGFARARVRGTADRPDVVVNLGVAGLRWQDRPVGDLTFDLETASQAGFTSRLTLMSPAPHGLGEVSLNLHGDARLPSLLENPNLVRDLAAMPLTADLRGDHVQLAMLAQLIGRPGVDAGTATVSAHLAGNTAGTRGDIAVDVIGFAGRGIPATDGNLRLALREHDVQAEIHVTRKQASLLSASANLHAPLAQLARPTTLADTPVEAHATLGPLAWQHVGVVSEVGHPRVLHGHLGAELVVGGTLRQPRARLMARTVDVRLDDKPAGAAVALIDYHQGRLDGDVNVVLPDGGRLLATASLDADLGYPAVVGLHATQNLSIGGSLQATRFDLAALSGLSPTLRTVAGQVEASLQLSGTVGDPRPAGRLEWKNGRLAVVGLGDYENIHLLVQGDRDHLSVQELRADSGAGHAKLTMSASHRQGGYDLASNLDLDKLPIYVQGQSLASISLRTSAKAQLDGGQVRSQIEVGSARIALSDAKRKHLQTLSQPGDVILVEDGRPVDKAQARKLATANRSLERRPSPAQESASAVPKPPSIVVTIDAPRDVWLVGKDANLEIGLEPGFRVELAEQTRIYGQVIVKRGHVDVLGRRFDLKESSSLRFSGPAEAPTLDVTAQYASAENDVTVVATIKGSPGHWETTLTAPGRPDLTESQLYTLLLTGHLGFLRNTSTSSTPASQAESLLGGLLASQLQTLAANKLPFDVLTIQTGATAGSARVEAGKYVTGDLYVGYVGRVGADPTLLQNRNAVHFEYALGSRWSFQGEYGDAKTGSLDLFWTKRY